ncbi:superoxide dismutase family protein [Bacillus marinisedimentorum]|uniref:superoxide dismutase family protein n=1 Tax=Bacillus marinisedimentorum TaxID=1821260 RepID=UPI001FDF750F|nr:superoxide dismutase family protein [Bacillus marinisedimentorum]
MKKVASIISFLFLLTAAACSESTPEPVDVDLYNDVGDTIGTAEIQPQNKGVKIKLEVSGIEPGVHGIHIHENAECEGPDFKSAGAHFNPEDNEHGLMNTEGPHAGDLQNIKADEEGKVDVELTAENVTLEENKPHSLLRENGTSVVIHEKADDGMTDPAGDAGERVACGEIVKKNGD